MEKWNLFQQGVWVVAVSGGADSMALLDMCVQRKIKVIAAHVNYQKRDSANRDMEGVQRYCAKYDIPCFVHKVETYTNDNFQAQAREIRYAFFKKVMNEQHCQGVLVAHHLDDVLETYVMQKQRGSIPSCYGIASYVKLMGMPIYRPLLAYTKKELEEYCQRRGIEFFYDESNFEDCYERNRIRHRIIDAMSYEEKQQMAADVKQLNQQHQNKQIAIMAYVDRFEEEIELADFLLIEKEMQKAILREFIKRQCAVNDLTEKHMNVLVQMLHDKKNNFKHTINGVYDLYCEYGKIYVWNRKVKDYAYRFNEIQFVSTPYFSIAATGKTIEGITVCKEDFPITIRNAHAGDKIELRFGMKKVSRFFIDRKISHKLRELWPVVVNSKGNIIYVCGIGCDIAHYSNNSNMFVLK